MTSVKEEMRLLVDSPEYEDRLRVAREGLFLDKLIHDREPLVRAQVAKHGYGLDILVRDDSMDVRRVVADWGYGLPLLVKDSCIHVLEAVALQGYGHEELSEHPSVHVRRQVARLAGSTTVTIERYFGTYKGPVYLHMWDDHYEIKSGCYSSESVAEWTEQCAEVLGEEAAELTARKITVTLSAHYGERVPEGCRKEDKAGYIPEVVI